MQIIAHRGASRDAPENTLAAVQLAWQQGADAVEVDVQISRDGRLVVIHDANTARTGRVKRSVCDQTLTELRALDAGRWKGSRWSGERIPTLEEVLNTVPEGKTLFVELKCGPDGLPAFLRTIEDAGRQSGQIVAIGFSRQMMRLLKAKLPGLKVCWIRTFRRNWKTGRWLPASDELIAAAMEARFDGVDLDARGPVNATLVNRLQSAGLKVYVWTVDSPAKARRLLAAGVDGITTNRPGWLRKQIEAKRARRTG